MPQVVLGYEARVPGNASRFFRTRQEALDQPDGAVQLVSDPDDPFIRNASFDASLIRHDESYCTSVVDLDQVVQLPTSSYFLDRVAPHLQGECRVVDIGCGQGEFVEYLRRSGVAADGYDPVLRSESPHLHRRYWSTDEPPADLYVMRCVLPHIPDPWGFLDELAAASPRCLALIEFQRAEWILENRVWYQVSHDHVNIFRAKDLADRYEVVDQGTFSDGEWAWVLIRPGRRPDPEPRNRGDWDPRPAVQRLADARSRSLDALVRSGRPLALWGAAGKGIVLAHALALRRDHIAVIDADPHRWGLYLEGSGLRVESPARAPESLPADTIVLVCNPNHLAAVHRHVRGRFTVTLPASLADGGHA